MAMDEFLSELSQKILAQLEPSGISLKKMMQAIEREVIRQKLDACPDHHGKVAALARVFGCKRTTLSMKMLEYGLRIKSVKTDDDRKEVKNVHA